MLVAMQVVPESETQEQGRVLSSRRGAQREHGGKDNQALLHCYRSD